MRTIRSFCLLAISLTLTGCYAMAMLIFAPYEHEPAVIVWEDGTVLKGRTTFNPRHGAQLENEEVRCWGFSMKEISLDDDEMYYDEFTCDSKLDGTRVNGFIIRKDDAPQSGVVKLDNGVNGRILYGKASEEYMSPEEFTAWWERYGAIYKKP